ncbi:MAG: GNAT family N-acetyltransferase [Micromonosporaceae bacterium]|nr:GNAT family N-acetyltransferase [Micromonosporaceae bacterium]
MSDHTIETARESDWDDIFRLVRMAFLYEHSDDMSATERKVCEIDRTLVARRDGELAGTSTIQTRQLAVPGGLVPAAHITSVAVAPTARRRGILTGLMRRMFDDALAAGEPVAVLWASEGRIYQRFGYGLATASLGFTIDRTEVSLTVPAPGGRLREAEPAALRDELVALYDRVYRQRPGWSERPPRLWDYRLADLKEWRQGGAEMRAVAHYDESGTIDGYALWRPMRRWSDSGPASEVRVIEHVAANPQAYIALWTYLTSVDLTKTVHAWFAAPDEPLLHAVSDPERLNTRLGDGLWVRVLDVPAAFAARRYTTDIDLVLEVTDAAVPANTGRWRLTGSPTGATCSATGDEPDLSCDVRALGAVYLGGTALTTLAGTGQVIEHTPGALARADAALRWYPGPSSQEVF